MGRVPRSATQATSRTCDKGSHDTLEGQTEKVSGVARLRRNAGTGETAKGSGLVSGICC